MFALGLAGHLFKFAGSIPAIGSMAVTGVTVGITNSYKRNTIRIKKISY